MTKLIRHRLFLMALASTTATVCTLANAQALVKEKDAQALAPGYVAEAERLGPPPGQSHRQGGRLRAP